MKASMLSRIFNRSNLKLILALAIPSAIMGLWFYAKYTAEKDIGITATAIKRNPINDKVCVTDYQLKEIDDSNHVRWRLFAETGISDPKTRDVALRKVNVDYFDGVKIKMHLSAPLGVANESTRAVELDCEKNARVKALGEEGKAELEASKVELMKKNQFRATGGVNILWPGVAKVTGDIAEGSLNSTDLKKLKIVGNTHALIGLQSLNKQGG
jgi:hypothetical protein